MNHSHKHRRRRPSSLLVTLLLGIIAAGWATVFAQVPDAAGGWELRLCADPNSLPFSNEAGEGFENRIAEILADELNARVSYDWYPQNRNMITYRLRAGECDLIMGVPDGLSALLSTVAYYRSPYVFVYRSDSGFEIESLDDPVLRDLAIAVQNVGIPPHDALVQRGLAGNVVSQHLEGEARVGAQRSRAVVDAVVAGEVDVALAWGPVAGYLAQQSEANLVIEPVTPQFEPPFRTQSFAMTIGVRPGDEALRDRLNIALARRWEEIRAVLEEYGVPLQQIPAPFVSPSSKDVTKIGFVTPTLTGATAIRESIYEIVGEAARMGALLAESDVAAGASETGPEIDLLFASTPNSAAAERAAHRLLATEGVSALIGGLGAGQAEVLAALAHDHAVPFFNMGAPQLERACDRYVFHIEASSSMYLGALVQWFTNHGSERWFIVHEDDAQGAELLQQARDAVREHSKDGEIVGTAAVTGEQPSYWKQLQAVRASAAQVVLLLLHPRDQITFMAQQESTGGRATVAPFPDPVTQTRNYLAAARYGSEGSGPSYRVLLWETTLEDDGANELNSSYTSRWGEPMNSSAWAAYQSVKILYQALLATANTEAAELIDYLESPRAEFAVGKGVPVSFRAGSHQLRQPLYVVEVDQDAPWGQMLSRKVAIAHLAGQLPTAEVLELNGADALDQMSGAAPASPCPRQSTN